MSVVDTKRIVGGTTPLVRNERGKMTLLLLRVFPLTERPVGRSGVVSVLILCREGLKVSGGEKRNGGKYQTRVSNERKISFCKESEQKFVFSFWMGNGYRTHLETKISK